MTVRLPVKLTALVLPGLAACAIPPAEQQAALSPQYLLQAPVPNKSPVAPPTVGVRGPGPKSSPLTTRWAKDVSDQVPLPEYPRPQLTRENWLNLNGQWQFQTAAADEAPPVGKTLDETILIPFAAEAALSGIQRFDDRMWYRRVFEVPEGWARRRVQLNFGAVDYEAKVWDVQEIGARKGGFDAFGFDATDALQDGKNELLVNVFDPTDDGGQPTGEQWYNPNGIWYTSVSGIWQTVWLEPVAETHISRLDLTPNIDNGTLRVKAQGENLKNQTLRITAFDGETVVGEASGPAGQELTISVDEVRLWSPDDPFLYDLVATVGDDTVGSYFGVRSTEVKEIKGIPRPLLSGEFVFQLGTLDQRGWPDGLYTAPTDEALKFDLQAHKDFGYNMVRKHTKVEPQRWFYHMDKLGRLVWQDMPSVDSKKSPSAAAKAKFENELRTMDQHRSSPAVITWVTLSEGWGQYDQARLADRATAYDPTRLVNMSGINCGGAVDGGNGDMTDYHLYTKPGVPTAEVSNGRVRTLGKYGRLGLRIEDHIWTDETRCCDGVVPSRKVLNERCLGQIRVLKSLMSNRGLSASVYTQISDVEGEINGLSTYNREVRKLDTEAVRAAHEDLLVASNQEPARVTLPIDTLKSFQVMTGRLTDRYLRHFEPLGFTEIVNDSGPDLLKNDATFEIVRALADDECYSLESKSVPGEYLRHRNSRVYTEDTPLDLAADTSWQVVAPWSP